MFRNLRDGNGAILEFLSRQLTQSVSGGCSFVSGFGAEQAEPAGIRKGPRKELGAASPLKEEVSAPNHYEETLDVTDYSEAHCVS